jgi:hypothetical protein
MNIYPLRDGLDMDIAQFLPFVIAGAAYLALLALSNLKRAETE